MATHSCHTKWRVLTSSFMRIRGLQPANCVCASRCWEPWWQQWNIAKFEPRSSMNAHSGTEVTAVHEVATHEFPKDSKPLFSPHQGLERTAIISLFITEKNQLLFIRPSGLLKCYTQAIGKTLIFQTCR